MDEILKLIIDKLSFLYQNYDLKFIDSEHSQSFGGQGFVILSNNKIELKFTNDRKQIFLDFKGVYDDGKEWYSIDLIRKLIDPKNNYSSQISDKSNYQFLKDNLDRVLNLFSLESIDSTTKQLKNLEEEQAERLFD